MKKRKVMGKREARKWLFSYAADLLQNFSDSAPLTNRAQDHDGDEEAGQRETGILQGEIPWVVDQLLKKGSWPQ